MTRLSNMAYHSKYSDAAQSQPKIKVFFLQASRCIRTVWLLEELGLPYEVEFADRVQQKAPQAFKDASENPLGKFPTIRDGDLTIFESGAITEYLCDKYDVEQRLMPGNDYLRAKVQMLVHAAEGTVALHSLAFLYANWTFPAALKESHPEALEQMLAGLSVNVQNDFDWLEGELSQSTGLFLVGNNVTAADVMMQFIVQFALERELGTKGKTWPKINEWLQRCENTEAYKRAVEKTGYTLHPKTI